MTQISKQTGDASNCCASLDELLSPGTFKALADANRIALLCSLAQSRRSSTVSEASECCAVDYSVVSRHLATLKNAGVLAAEKKGREVYYSVKCSELAAWLREVADAIEACCPPGENEALPEPQEKR